MKKLRGPVDCHQALRITHILFYGSFALLVLDMLLLGASVMPFPFAEILGALGFIGICGGLVFGFVYVKCPYCGATLFLGGRIPDHIPSYCPDCGKPLN